MELLNKFIYYNKFIYKIVDINKNNYYINKLLVDNELLIEFDYDDIINFPKTLLLHFENNINEKEQLKIKNLHKKSYTLIENVDNCYLSNGELHLDYINKWSNVVNELNLQTEYCVKYYISLLTNGKFKKRYYRDRDDELYFFCLLIARSSPPIKNSLSYLEVIESLGFTKIFNVLKEEAIRNEMKKFKIAPNETCPCCLSDEINNYIGLYKCSHHTCYDCYINWQSKTCPICRAGDNYINS